MKEHVIKFASSIFFSSLCNKKQPNSQAIEGCYSVLKIVISGYLLAVDYSNKNPLKKFFYPPNKDSLRREIPPEIFLRFLIYFACFFRGPYRPKIGKRDEVFARAIPALLLAGDDYCGREFKDNRQKLSSSDQEWNCRVADGYYGVIMSKCNPLKWNISPRLYCSFIQFYCHDISLKFIESATKTCVRSIKGKLATLTPKEFARLVFDYHGSVGFNRHILEDSNLLQDFKVKYMLEIMRLSCEKDDKLWCLINLIDSCFSKFKNLDQGDFALLITVMHILSVKLVSNSNNLIFLHQQVKDVMCGLLSVAYGAYMKSAVQALDSFNKKLQSGNKSFFQSHKETIIKLNVDIQKSLIGGTLSIDCCRWDTYLYLIKLWLDFLSKNFKEFSDKASYNKLLPLTDYCKDSTVLNINQKAVAGRIYGILCEILGYGESDFWIVSMSLRLVQASLIDLSEPVQTEGNELSDYVKEKSLHISR